MEGYQSSLDGSNGNLISIMTIMMMPKASLECLISYFVFYFSF